MKNKIGAKIIADSLSMSGHRLTTMVIKFPRYILAELNTHRAISKNSASSRAKPFKVMLKSVQEDPFIPVAWMKDHPGMQGSAYFDHEIVEVPKTLAIDVNNTQEDINSHLEFLWLNARDAAVRMAEHLSEAGLTKQIVNRILEPFMWHEVIVTATDWENFFGLRCPQYVTPVGGMDEDGNPWVYRSRKDVIEAHDNNSEMLEDFTDLEWRKLNKGMADIHIMDLAEAMWDAYNESEPRLLQDGMWHLPYIDNEDEIMAELSDLIIGDGPDCIMTEHKYYRDDREDYQIFLPYLLKISAARCARISYKTFGEDSKIDLLGDIKLHDRLLVSKPIHASPAEHQGQAMDELEISENYIYNEGDTIQGASRNFRGFRQYRTLLANETIW